jgi:hypothetical protein
MLGAAGFRPHAGRRFLVTFALLLACLVAWSVATPMYGSPDEPAHMVKAYAIVHRDSGTWNMSGKYEYLVPPQYTAGDVCYAFRREQPANCLQLPSPGPDHLQSTAAEPYPPFYYVLVGWPTLITPRVSGLYMMRAASAAWVALLLALALHNVFELRNRRSLLVGAALALTPAVFFFGATVNPSGLSIAAGMAAWTGGFALLRTDRLLRAPLALAKVGAPLCLFLLLRRDSVLWAGLMLISLAVITPRDRRHELRRSRVAWAWGAAVVASALLQLNTGGAATATGVGEAGEGSLSDAWNDIPNYIDQIGGGVLGWLDTPVPNFVLDVFTYGTGLLAILALCFAPRRLAIAVVAFTALVVTAPLTIGAIRHPYFQGRYMLPFAVGIALTAGLGLTESVRTKRWLRYLPIVAFPLIGAAHVHAFAQTLRRHTAGTHGDWFFTHATPWGPPGLSATVLTILYSIAIIALLTWLFVQSLADATPSTTPAPDDRLPDGGLLDADMALR